MKRFRFFKVFLCFMICARAAAQDPRSGEPYLVPQTVYVGDVATLVLPLAAEGAAKDGTVVLDPKLFPVSAGIELRRVALERRPSGSRLLIEFAAFTPGDLELPPIEIGGERFSCLRVTIGSVIGGGQTDAVLSAPARPLAIPGTGLLVYGTLGAFTLFLLLSLWAGIWGRRHLSGWLLKWQRMRLIVSMAGIEKRLRRSLLREGKARETLNSLSGEFRAFLSFFTGENCRAMTAAELGQLPPEALALWRGGECAEDAARELGGDFLGPFFRRCDTLRFSGSEIISNDEVLAMLGDLRRFLAALYKTGRRKSVKGRG
jgi:hypothetical protein